MPLIRIEDRHQDTEFDGTRIAGPVTSGNQPRWLSMTIYKAASGGYILHRVGMSVVYHEAETSCQTILGQKSGSPATIVDLPDEALPCERCSPPYPADLGDTEQVRFEFPRHTIDKCADARGVVEKLTTINPRGGQKTIRISEPVGSLLAEAAAADPEFAAAPKLVERL